jgi:hypothetical protein
VNVETFWSLVDKTDGCWWWQGNKDPLGYGRVWMHLEGDRVQLAHRAAFILIRGFHPGDLDHICTSTNCVNPDHLQEASRGKNFSLGWARRGWGPHSRRIDGIPHCKNGHAMTLDNIVVKGRLRRCRACMKREGHERYLRLRAMGRAPHQKR